MEKKDWHTVGVLIATLHQQNVFHGDLNITNILVNENDDELEKFLLIDFDKSKQKFMTYKDKQSNLNRISRSLKKNKLFDENNFNILLEGYNKVSFLDE